MWASSSASAVRPRAVEVERVVDLHHDPFTRIWVTTTLSPVPVGTQTAWLSCSKTGTPPERTRTAARHPLGRHAGPAPRREVNAQPATV